MYINVKTAPLPISCSRSVYKMPHAEKHLSHLVHDSSIEPCLKRSRPDSSSSWAWKGPDFYKEHEATSQKWSFSTSLEERTHQSGHRGDINVKYDSYVEEVRCRHGKEQDDTKSNQHPCELPRKEKNDSNCDVTFSGTSTSFIGPQYRPSPQEKPHLGVPGNPSAAPSFKIATVEVGKFASQSKGKHGMDYELRQFYKELNELEAEVDDQTKVTNTEVDVGSHIVPRPDKSPAARPSNHHHGQVPTSQPYGSSNLVSLTFPSKEEPGPHLERPPLPLNNLFSGDGPRPYPPTNSSFVSHAIPPPRFDGGPPPTFIVPYGPPPPRFNFPMTFPRPGSILPPPTPPAHNLNYNIRHEIPWHRSPVPPKSCYSSQGIPHNKTFSQDTSERTWRDLQCNGLYGPQDGQSGEQMLPHMGNRTPIPYPGRSEEKSRRLLVLLRGVPGSGKSTLARTLLQQSPDGIVLSTDDYFCQENGYTYDVKLLGDAHSWNQNRARRALDDGRSPVIIDNTNIQGWEMKPYVQMAVDRRYDVEFMEPDTWWKKDAQELERRNTHRVPRDKISQMLERYEHEMTVPVVMNAVEPRHARPNRPPPEARPRTPMLKKKRYQKSHKIGRKIASDKDRLSLQKDEELEILALEQTETYCKVGRFIIDAAGIGKVRVKMIFSGKEGYLLDCLAELFLHHSNISTAAFLGMVSRLMDLTDRRISQLISKSESLVSHGQHLFFTYLLSAVVGGMLYKGTNSVRPFLRWLRAHSKGLLPIDQSHSRNQNIMNEGIDLYHSFIVSFLEQPLALYDVKYFELQTFSWSMDQLPGRVNKNQDGKSNQKLLWCQRQKNPPLEKEIVKHKSQQIRDNSKSSVETNQTIPQRHRCRRRIYKLAPTFQHPRILSGTQISSRTDKCGNVATAPHPETDAVYTTQNLPEDYVMRSLVRDECIACLTSRGPSCRLKDASVSKAVIYEEDLCPLTFKFSDGPQKFVLKKSYSGFPPGAQSCAGLCLPEQFARQLVELFGCPGVELDAFDPKDYIVPLGYDLARRIHQRWKTSLEEKCKFLPAT
ncbi:uncharacterized protein [Engystomops pustulosus]|uniref:uncharacterized protein isoform X2 n=1 Tax=Engystomops pustulosus TaxID=76066 RepID=UPI003AFAD859